MQCEWQPIHTCPRNGTPVLLFHPTWDMLEVGVHYLETHHWQNRCGDLLPTPTYWMPLPPLPHRDLQPAESVRAG